MAGGEERGMSRCCAPGVSAGNCLDIDNLRLKSSGHSCISTLAFQKIPSKYMVGRYPPTVTQEPPST